MSELTAIVTVGLEPDGWRRRDLGNRPWAAFTKPLADGVQATIELRFVSVSSDPWPAPLSLRFGAGYDPATALMPVVTLPWEVALVDEPAPERLDGPLVIPDADGLAEVAAVIVELSLQHAVDFAQQYDSVAALDAALAAASSSLEAHHQLALRAVLLAASGQHDAARRLVDDFPLESLGDGEDLRYRRFVRQLRRWLDAGGPPIPPLEQTLSEMPPPSAPRTPPTWSQTRQRSRNQQAALKAVETAARGKSHDEIVELFAAEYSARGLEMPSASEIAVSCDLFETGQRTFGRTRKTLKAFKLLKDIGGDTIGAIRHGPGPKPAWLEPPEEASYPSRIHARFAAVDVADDAYPLLLRALTEGPRRIGPYVHIDLWLTQAEVPETGAITVHLGNETVGKLTQEVATRFRADMRAAAAMDEKVRVPGRLIAIPETDPILEIGLPRSEAAGD